MKKHKKIKGRKRKKSGHSQTSVTSARKRTTRLVAIGLILCLAIVSLYFAWTFNKSGEEPKKSDVPTSSTEQPVAKPNPSKLTTEQQFDVLKKEEMELAQQVLKDFPNSDQSYVLMGDLYSRHGNSTEAMKFWGKGLEINPNRFDVYRKIGQFALKNEEFDKAVEFGRKALELKPNTPGVRSDIARALMDSGKYVEAIPELEKEIKISPKSVTAHFQIAEAHLQQKEYDKAKKYYEETIKLEPNHSHAYHGLITVHMRLKQQDKAKEYLAIFKELKAKQAYAYMGRQWDTLADLASLRASVVRTYLDAERLYSNSGKISDSEGFLKRACELGPDNPRCLERLAFLYYKTNRPDEALKYFEKVVLADPNNPFSHINVGQVAARLKKFDRAERAFKRSVELGPNKAGGYRELANMYLRNNSNLLQAKKLAQIALSLEKTAANYFLFGWASDVNGDRIEALKAMEQAIKLEPNNRQYRMIYERIRARK